MKESNKSLKLLKRNQYCTILLGLLLPLFTIAVLKEDAKIVSTISAVVIVLSVFNLSYLTKIESALDGESTTNRPYES